MGWRAFANRSIVEVSSGLRIDYDGLSRGAVALAAHGDGAGVLTSHGHSAVRAGGILLVGCEATRASPAIGSSSLPLRSQIDGFSNAIGAVSINQGGHDTTVGGAGADIGKRDVAALVRIVGNEQNVILS